MELGKELHQAGAVWKQILQGQGCVWLIT